MSHSDSYLQQLLSNKYRNIDMTKRDVLNVFLHYRGLKPQIDAFVFNDGSQHELLNLYGTIPVSYKGSMYNIPVSIWLLDTHPYNAPLAYVKPTAEMEISVSRYVDQNGRVYLPYLNEWNPSSSDLLGLIQVMITVFGEQPPVYSRPHPSLYPKQQAGYMPMPGAVTSTTTSYPRAAYPSTPSYQPTVTTTTSYMPEPYPGYQSNPPYPSYSQTGSNNYTPYPSAAAGYPVSSYPPYPQTSTAQPATFTGPTTGTISEEHIRVSLLSAVQDKLRWRLKEVFAQASAEMEVLKKTQQDLMSGKTRLEDICRKLENEQVELSKNIVVLTEKEREMKEIISKLEGQESLDVDEAVITTAPLYKQLLNAYAEEAATEDAIYYLGEALRRGLIDLDVFLKHVRSLSRKQFMLRALMQRCRQKAGLAA